LAAFFLLPFSCNESKENGDSVCSVVDDHVSSLAAAAAGRCSLTLRSFRTDLGLSVCRRRVFCFLCFFYFALFSSSSFALFSFCESRTRGIFVSGSVCGFSVEGIERERRPESSVC
jgi:hypothetical protein